MLVSSPSSNQELKNLKGLGLLVDVSNFAREELRRIGNGKRTSNRGGGYVRLTKVDFPKFSGDDVNEWFFRVHQFFFINTVNEDQKVSEINMPVRMFKPTTLKDAFCLARMQKATLALNKTKPVYQFASERSNGSSYASRYVHGHKCHGQMYSLEVSVDDCDEVVEVSDNGEIREQNQNQVYDESFPQISLNALSGFKWTLQGYEYNVDCMLLPLGGYDMVFETQWLSILGDINYNFEYLIMKFNHNGKRIVSRGSHNGSLQWIQGKQIIIEGQWKHAQLASIVACVYHAQPMQVHGETTNTCTSKLPLQHLLDTYVDVFEMPTQLPSSRTHDHYINLFSNTTRVIVRPYRLPLNQKDVVEHIVKELLEASAIREIQSPFSSPIVMVKKKDVRLKVRLSLEKNERGGDLQDNFQNTPRALLVLSFALWSHQCSLNILSPNEAEHLQHLHQVSEVIRANTLYAKQSNYRHLRFIKNYARIIESLTKLLNKNGFKWSTVAESAFNQLKQAMMTTPVLALPYFEKEFVVETDDSYCGIGVILHQDGHPIAYLTKALSPAHRSFSTYEKEFLAVIIGLDSYGQPLPTYVPYVSGDSHVEAVDKIMQIIKKVGQVAYELELPTSSDLHNVFHVSQLKKCTHPIVTSGTLPYCDIKGLLIKTPVVILKGRLGNRAGFEHVRGGIAQIVGNFNSLLPFDTTITSRSTDVVGMAIPVQNLTIRLSGRCFEEKLSGFTSAPQAGAEPYIVASVGQRFMMSLYLCLETAGSREDYGSQLERLGYMLPQDISVGLILNGLTKDFVGFVRNYNMHNMGKTIGEIHAMLIEYEKGLPKKAETPQPNNPKSAAKERPAKDDACHHCKEVGHWKRNCPVYLAELQKKRKQVGSASSSGIERKLKQGALYLYVGNGVRAQVEAIGSFDLVLPNGLVICLDNCHYAPTITRVSKNNVHYFNVIPSNGIYEIDMHDLVLNFNSIYNVSTKRTKHNLDSTYLWHCRLARISKKRIKKLQQEWLLKSTDDESFDQCVSCLSGKMTRKSFPHRPKRATGLLRIIHTDVCGLLRHVSRQGVSYFITFTDDYIHYGYVYLLKHKHELNPPYTPQHNRVSERRNHTLLDVVRSMMNLTTLPLSFWDYALESSTRILNMVPTKKVDKTLYELLSVKCIFIGYPKETMGYYFYFPPENKIVVARYAEFFEKNIITQEVSRRAIDLEKIQDEDTLPSEITSEIPMEVEGFEPPQEEDILILRSKRTRRAPNCLSLNIEVEEHSLGDLNEPTSYKATMLDSESNKWIDAMNAELQSMMDNMVWVLVDLPPGCKTVRSKVDYEETFSPVANIKSIRILISIAAYYDYEIWQMDIKTAFLNGYLDEDIYMVQPEGFVDPNHPRKVCKLQRSIYGLKQASRSWNKRFDEEIKRFGFTQNLDEPCVYQKASGSNVTFLILYVDDIIIMGNHIPSLQSGQSQLIGTWSTCIRIDLEEDIEWIIPNPWSISMQERLDLEYNNQLEILKICSWYMVEIQKLNFELIAIAILDLRLIEMEAVWIRKFILGLAERLSLSSQDCRAFLLAGRKKFAEASMCYVPLLELPVSRYVMKGVYPYLVEWSDLRDDTYDIFMKSDDDDDDEDKDEVAYGEATVEIFKNHRGRVERQES
ncbi:retrotransposon protein, putative, ty1-copia subclass [Tanacetum coccineum]